MLPLSHLGPAFLHPTSTPDSVIRGTQHARGEEDLVISRACMGKVEVSPQRAVLIRITGRTAHSCEKKKGPQEKGGIVFHRGTANPGAGFAPGTQFMLPVSRMLLAPLLGRKARTYA